MIVYLRRRRERQKDNSMRISSIIEQLSEIQIIHGDLEVVVSRPSFDGVNRIVRRNPRTELRDYRDHSGGPVERVAAIEVD